MKIYLVTMKSLPNDSINERLKCMAIEAAWHADHPNYVPAAKVEEVMEEADPDPFGTPVPVPAPAQEGPPARQYSWINQKDDAAKLAVWRNALTTRKTLLESAGITINPDREPKEDANEYERNRHFDNPTFACVGDQLLKILEVDDSITVKSAAPIATDSHEGLLARLAAVVAKLENVEIPDPQNIPGHIYNEHCEVHTPGNMLATYNETMLLEDCCTDQLQTSMDDGWRIVAVCPQAQRRPDYIMGRWNPDYASGNGAKRKP